MKDQQITKMQAQLMEATATHTQLIEKINRIEELLGKASTSKTNYNTWSPTLFRD